MAGKCSRLLSVTAANGALNRQLLNGDDDENPQCFPVSMPVDGNRLTFSYLPVMCLHLLKSFKSESVWPENTFCLPCKERSSPNAFCTSEQLICLKRYRRLDFLLFIFLYSLHTSHSINGLGRTFLCERLKECRAMNSEELTRLITAVSQY